MADLKSRTEAKFIQETFTPTESTTDYCLPIPTSKIYKAQSK